MSDYDRSMIYRDDDGDVYWWDEGWMAWLWRDNDDGAVMSVTSPDIGDNNAAPIAPVRGTPANEMSDERLDRIEARLEALEAERTPTDTPDPEPGEPKVVGWVSGRFPDDPKWRFAQIDQGGADLGSVPLILQSDHEAVVRGLMEENVALMNEYDEARWVMGKRTDEIARLKAENERLTRERDAYADPGNWRVKARSILEADTRHELIPRYIGPTPSDSTEADEGQSIRDAWTALGFFRSAIQSGEPWTEECDRIYRAAHGALVVMEKHSAPPWEEESVEGTVGADEFGYQAVWLPTDAEWDHGARVRITRIPGGDDE